MVTFKDVPQEITLGAAAPAAPFRPTTARPKFIRLVLRRRFLLIGAAVLFLLFIAGAGWYYYRASTSIPPAAPPAPLPPRLESVEPGLSEPASEPAFAPILEPAPAAPTIREPGIEFPSRFLADTVDLDQDGLTDLEEEVFAADPAASDTDQDHYSDSHEVYNLYNPIGKEPIKLIDSGLIKAYTNPVWRYRLYYPKDWALGEADAEFRQVLFSTFTGEHVEVRVFDKSAGDTFSDWFARLAPQENQAELVDFSSVFKESGFRRSDYLVYYFTDSNHVYGVVYRAGSGATVIGFRTVIKMIARSFRMVGNGNALPPQAGGATSSVDFPFGHPPEVATATAGVATTTR